MALHCFSGAHALNMSVANVDSILVGFQNFLDRHTGDVSDAGDGIYCINTADVLMNNLHYEVALSGYMPNGTSTTEGQSLLILGYLHLHRAFKNRGVENNYLDQAKRFMNAYLTYFYRDTPIPNKAQVWRCHWAINGKMPFRTFGPVNFQDPSASGAWDVPVQFNAGIGYVPAGSPYYGEQVTRVYNVYDGKMNWDNVMATPKGGRGTYEMDFFVDDRKIRMTYDGDELDDGPQTTYPTRYIQLKDKTFTGVLNISFACRSGHIIDRNHPFEGWPMWQHVEKAYYGNSGDSEEWFCEALWMMFNITKEQKYLRAFNACAYTLWNMANLPSQSVMFIRDTMHSTYTPFTEGISYWWNVCKNADALCVRNPADGYIRIEKTEELFIEDSSQVAIEQMALINKVNQDSYIAMEMGINSDPNIAPMAKMNIFCRVSDSLVPETGRVWRHPVWSNNNVNPTNRQYYFRNMVAQDDGAGNEYVMLSGQSFVPYNQAKSDTHIEYGILGNSARNDFCGAVSVPNGSSGVVLGFWGAEPTTRPLKSITYKYTSSQRLALYIRDANNWKWQFILPGAGNGNWQTVNIPWGSLTLMAKQDNTGPRPSAPAINNALTQVQVGLPDGDQDAVGSAVFYCFNDVPPVFSGWGYMNWFKFMIVDHYDFVCNIGDISVQNTLELRAKYTPGVIPFSTNYSQKKGKVEFYRGTPYTGYVYPVCFLIQGKLDAVQNCVDYFYDAQQDYYNKKGIWGPMAPVYIWPRWDNVNYGAPETFVYVEWGYHRPWAGYYSRALFSACHLWEEMKKMNLPISPKLITVCERWMTYLADFMDKNDDNTPTVFPVDGLPYNDGYDPDPNISSPDHTGHMTAHFLCSAIMMKNAGSTHPKLDRIIEGCVREFERTYYVSQGRTEHMSGAYTSWAGGNYFYGFWAGEIMRAFGMLLEYRDKQNRMPVTVVEDDLWRIGLEDGSTLITQDGGEFMYDNPVYFDSMVLPLLMQDGVSQIMLEDGVGFLCTEPE